MANLVNNLQNLQFEIIKARIVMASQTSDTMSTEYYNIQFLLQSGSIQVYQNIYNDALFQVDKIFWNFLLKLYKVYHICIIVGQLHIILIFGYRYRSNPKKFLLCPNKRFGSSEKRKRLHCGVVLQLLLWPSRYLPESIPNNYDFGNRFLDFGYCNFNSNCIFGS